MKKFFEEFKKFITRGNVVDMAVGVIVGSSFTAIVNGLSNNILKPLINWLLAMIFGANSLSEVYTFLKRVEVEKEILNDAGEVIGMQLVPDLTQSIYIDWGAFINTVINFFIVAFVLFVIVKIFNRLREGRETLIKKEKLTRLQRKELKANGVDAKDKAAVEAYLAEKKRLADEAAAAAAALEAEKARLEREANPTAEDLLKQILAELRKEA